MRKQRKKWVVTGMACLFCLLLLTSCAEKEDTKEEQNETGFVAAQTGVYDSADTAVVAEIDMEETVCRKRKSFRSESSFLKISREIISTMWTKPV